MTDVHINFRRVAEVRRTLTRCPTCKRRRRHALEFEHYYGWTLHCCGCGDSWQETCDGWWRTPRPARRGWRAEAITRAKGLWRSPYLKEQLGAPA